MRFSDTGYYIEAYVKCDNCGVLIYGEGVKARADGLEDLIFCSDWCTQWKAARARGETPRIPLSRS